MPTRLKRLHHSGQTHFATFSCWHRQPNFADPAARPVFKAALERIRLAFVLRVYGYVIMPDHVHLLLSEPRRETLAAAIKSLKQGVSRRLVRDSPHFWQKRYYDFNVGSHDQFIEKLRYTHRNPVRKGLCERPEDWEWSRAALPLRNRIRGFGGNRIGMDGKQAGKSSRAAVRIDGQPHSSKKRLSGPPVAVTFCCQRLHICDAAPAPMSQKRDMGHPALRRNGSR